MDTMKHSMIAHTGTRAWILRGLGAGLLLATGAIHLDLYLTGYRHIPTIGTLFLLQVIAAFVLAVLTVAFARRSVALAGAGFAISTLGGYILSLWFGLFGFSEIRTTAGIVAGLIEVSAFVVLSTWAIALPTAQNQRRVGLVARRVIPPLGALAVLALVLAVATSPGIPTAPVSATTNLGSATTTSMKVSIKNFMFTPATFTVAPGATVIITNHDSVTHTCTAMPGSHPLGAFNSGSIGPGKSVTITAPAKAGSYAYYCGIHNYMTGTLIVK
jgi:plastocyanin